MTSRGLFGDIALFRPAPFVIKSYWEMITYALMGVLLGVLAAGYIRFFHATSAFFRRLQMHKWLKLGAGLMVVGIIAIVLPDNLSDGYPVIDLAFAGQLGVVMLSSLAAAKFFATRFHSDVERRAGFLGRLFSSAR